MKKRYLILEDGTIFQGWAFGAEKAAIGELVFNTNVVGFVELLTDPSCYGQMLMQTFPMVGNYGITEEDFEGEPHFNGYVVKEWCQAPSNFRCQYDLDTFLKKYDIPGLYGVDTRELTNRIREYGTTNAMITDVLPDDMEEISAYAVHNAVAAVTCKETYTLAAEGEEKFHVAVLDCGVVRSVLRGLTSRSCRVTVLPANTSAEEVLALDPDGVLVAGGPGDPAECTDTIETLRNLLGKKPIFGVALGNQLLALANGGKTVKLKYGHRGGNQPCRQVGGHRTYITSQNHGFAVVSGSVENAVETFVNANDGTCEGLDYPELGAFSVQFMPDACTGVNNQNFLFDRFLSLMEEK